MAKHKKAIVTTIIQDEAIILTRDDFEPERYDEMFISDKWVLVEYTHLKATDEKPLRTFVPNYSLQYDRIPDHSKVEIVPRSNNIRSEVIRRHCHQRWLTTEQLAVFNETCRDGKKSIEWHSADWVAMDRKHYDQLMAAANGNSLGFAFIDEYSPNDLEEDKQ